MDKVVMIVLMEMLMERPPPMPRRGGDDDGIDPPNTHTHTHTHTHTRTHTLKALMLQDMSSPRVGEDFRLRRRLCKSWENEEPRRCSRPKRAWVAHPVEGGA
jgi:hypothetical protein